MKDLGNSRPVILAFGDHAYRLARKHLRPEEYSLLVNLPHYSDYRFNKETYKAMVFKEIAAQKGSRRTVRLSDCAGEFAGPLEPPNSNS